MKIKLFIITFVIITSVLLYSYLSKVPHLMVRIDSKRTYAVLLNLSRPLNLKKLIDSIEYITLHNSENLSTISKVAIDKERIYVLSESMKTLSIFSKSGDFIFSIKRSFLDNFQIDNGKILVYDREKGIVYKYNLDGNQIDKKHIGYHGIEMIKVRPNLYAFYTAGLATKDKESQQYEFVTTDSTGKLLSYLYPIPEENQNLRYNPGRRFHLYKNKLIFTPTFAYEILGLDSQVITRKAKVDFGKNSIDLTALKSILIAEDIYQFPYIFDFNLLAVTDRFYFISYTFKGHEGYAILPIQKAGLIVSGLGYTYENIHGIIPVGSFENGLIGFSEPAHSPKGDYRIIKYNLKY